MAAEIAQPLSVVDELFNRHILGGTRPGAEWGERKHFVEVLGLQDEARFAQIPCLNDVELVESVSPFSLVRFRGFVQDVFEPEIYEATVQETDESSGQVRLLTTKYRECVEAAPGKALSSLGTSSYGQRGACYCVPLPGETTWAQAAAATWTQDGGGAITNSVQTAPPSRPKRSRPDEDIDMKAPPPPAGEPREKRPTPSSGAAPQQVVGHGPPSAEQFGLNFPIPSEENRGNRKSVACIVKLYDDDAEVLRLCDAVEVVGILCVNPEVASLNALEHSGLSDARQPSTSFVPRLHALCVRRLPYHNPLVPYTPDWLSEERLVAAFQRSLAAPGVLSATRNAALNQLTSCLGGDVLAAQYVLMLLVTRSFGKVGEQSLGTWSLNIGCWPEGLDASKLKETVGQLVPRVACYDITAESLNTKRWRPVKDFAANRLVASQLQLAAGTVVIFDETKMAAGNLADAGVRNVGAIRTLVNDQVLTCDFQSYEVSIPLEVQTINLSLRKSIIADIDVILPLCPTAHNVAAPEAGALDAVRLLIALVTRTAKPMVIPDDVAQKFAEDFSVVRQQQDIKPDLAHTWMSLARAFCLTCGDNDLSAEKWSQVLELEGERLRRCRQEKLLSP